MWSGVSHAYLCTGLNKALAIPEKTVSLCCISWRTSWIMQRQCSTTDIRKSCLNVVNLVISFAVGIIVQINCSFSIFKFYRKEVQMYIKKVFIKWSLLNFKLDIHNHVYFLEYINKTYDVLQRVYVNNVSENMSEKNLTANTKWISKS